MAQQRRGEGGPRCQVLWVPWVDLSRQSGSYALFATGFWPEKPTMEWYTRTYFSDPADATDPLVSPLLGDVTGVCPAMLLIAGFDTLRDEGIAYGEKLRAAGVPARMVVYRDLIHAVINIAGLRAARHARL